VRRFVPFLLILFLIAAILRIDFYFTIAYLLFLVYGLSRLWVRRGLTNLRVERRFANRAFTGDDVAVRVGMHNGGRLPLAWIEAHESLPVDLISPPFHREVFSLRAGERRHFDYTLYCRRRGVYPLGPLQVQAGDLLGLEAPRVAEVAADPLIVYPHVVHLPRLWLPTHSPLAALPARAPLFEDPARVTGVRDYAPGDSLRRIHWTATASAGHLLVKQYQPAIARETLICLDMNPASYEMRRRHDASELAVVVAASLAHHVIVRERLPAGLVAEALDGAQGAPARFFLPARRERGHLMSVLEALARVQLAPGPTLAEILRRERPRLAWGTTLIAVTGRADPDLFDSLGALRRGGFPVALVLVQADLHGVDRERAAVLGVPVRSVWKERDLEQWL
jgi:uncharacterized protein (DUF58 family)